MEFKVMMVSPELTRQKEPAVWERRPRHVIREKEVPFGTFWVSQVPMDHPQLLEIQPGVRGLPSWTFTNTGDEVRIPLFSYRIPPQVVEGVGYAMAMGVQLGLQAMAGLHLRSPGPPDICYLALSEVIRDEEDTSRVFLGVAFRC